MTRTVDFENVSFDLKLWLEIKDVLSLKNHVGAYNYIAMENMMFVQCIDKGGWWDFCGVRRYPSQIRLPRHPLHDRRGEIGSSGVFSSPVSFVADFYIHLCTLLLNWLGAVQLERNLQCICKCDLIMFAFQPAFISTHKNSQFWYQLYSAQKISQMTFLMIFHDLTIHNGGWYWPLNKRYWTQHFVCSNLAFGLFSFSIWIASLPETKEERVLRGFTKEAHLSVIFSLSTVKVIATGAFLNFLKPVSVIVVTESVQIRDVRCLVAHNFRDVVLALPPHHVFLPCS